MRATMWAAGDMRACPARALQIGRSCHRRRRHCRQTAHCQDNRLRRSRRGDQPCRDVRARVKGYLDARVLFKEGDLVKEGAALYRIEKGLFQAAVEQAQGALEKSKAQHELAIKNRKRQEGNCTPKTSAQAKPWTKPSRGRANQGRHDDQ